MSYLQVTDPRLSIASPFKPQTIPSFEALEFDDDERFVNFDEMATVTGTSQSVSDSESYDDHESDSSATNSRPVTSSVKKVTRWSKFVRNLYEMTIDPKNAHAVGFSSDGLCLEIRDSKLLSSDVLHRYFKHKNVSSFIRQLNNYGFKTVPIVMNSSLSHCFAHDNFQKDRMDLLGGVVRRAGSADPAKNGSESIEGMKRKAADFEQRMTQLIRMNEELRQQNQELQEENKRLRASWHQAQDALRYRMYEPQQHSQQVHHVQHPHPPSHQSQQQQQQQPSSNQYHAVAQVSGQPMIPPRRLQPPTSMQMNHDGFVHYQLHNNANELPNDAFLVMGNPTFFVDE